MQPARAERYGKPRTPLQTKAGWTGQGRFARRRFLAGLRSYQGPDSSVGRACD